jgi:hypothetical protein
MNTEHEVLIFELWMLWGGSGNITCTAPALIVSEEEIQEGIGSYGFGAATGKYLYPLFSIVVHGGMMRGKE